MSDRDDFERWYCEDCDAWRANSHCPDCGGKCTNYHAVFTGRAALKEKTDAE